MNAVKNFINRASTADLQRLAKLARTTIGTLRHIGGGYRKSNVTAELAVRIDQAAAVLSRRYGTPPIPREKLSAACARCEFAKRCRKA